MVHDLVSGTFQVIDYEIASLLEVSSEVQSFEEETLRLSKQTLEAVENSFQALPSFVPESYSTTPVMGL